MANLLNLLGINLSLSSTEMVSLLLIWVVAVLLIQTILIGVLIKKSKNSKNSAALEQKLDQVIESQQAVKEELKEQINEKEQSIEKILQEQKEAISAQKEVAKEAVETPTVIQQVVSVDNIEELLVEIRDLISEIQVVERPFEEAIEEEQPVVEEEIEEEEAVEEEEITEEAASAAVAEEIVEDEIEEDEVEDEDDEEEEFDEEDDEDEEEEEDDEEDELGEIEIGGKALRPKYAYPVRIKLVSDKVKGFYTQIKNEFLSYGIKSRISKTKENFNHSRDNVARFVVRGKTLKLYIALDPTTLDHAYFHHKDVSEKKTYAEIPTVMPIKSRLAMNKAKELIAMLAENLGLVKKRRFQDKDFSSDLSAEGLTYVEKKGFGYLKKNSIALEDVDQMPEELAERFTQSSEATNKINRFIRTRVALDALAEKFQDGETVTIEAVRSRGIGASNANYLIVEDGSVLDKKLTVYA
ncbi:MAG: hypothetical protein K2J89_05160, partial [Clostridia bacterium]|nr:hypothetical protein [Clostridia bacterium]